MVFIAPDDRTSAQKALLRSTIGALREYVTNIVCATGHFLQFSACSVKESVIKASTLDGKRALVHAHQHTCLVPSTADYSSLMSSVPALLDGPACILTVGPYVSRFDLSWDDLQDSVRVVETVVQHLSMLPSLSFGQRLKICVDVWRACAYLHGDTPPTPTTTGGGEAAYVALEANTGRLSIVHGDLSEYSEFPSKRVTPVAERTYAPSPLVGLNFIFGFT